MYLLGKFLICLVAVGSMGAFLKSVCRDFLGDTVSKIFKIGVSGISGSTGGSSGRKTQISGSMLVLLGGRLEGVSLWWGLHSSYCCRQWTRALWTHCRSMGARSCWPMMQDTAEQLWKISMGIGRLGPIGVLWSLMSAWGMGILEALALLRMVQVFSSKKQLNWGRWGLEGVFWSHTCWERCTTLWSWRVDHCWWTILEGHPLRAINE